MLTGCRREVQERERERSDEQPLRERWASMVATISTLQGLWKAHTLIKQESATRKKAQSGVRGWYKKGTSASEVDGHRVRLVDRVQRLVELDRVERFEEERRFSTGKGRREERGHSLTWSLIRL